MTAGADRGHAPGAVFALEGHTASLRPGLATEFAP